MRRYRYMDLTSMPLCAPGIVRQTQVSNVFWFRDVFFMLTNDLFSTVSARQWSGEILRLRSKPNGPWYRRRLFKYGCQHLVGIPVVDCWQSWSSHSSSSGRSRLTCRKSLPWAWLYVLLSWRLFARSLESLGCVPVPATLLWTRSGRHTGNSSPPILRSPWRRPLHSAHSSPPGVQSVGQIPDSLGLFGYGISSSPS